MKNRTDRRVYAFLFVAILSTGQALMCYGTLPDEQHYKQVDCGHRSCEIMYTYSAGLFRTCAFGVYPTGVVGRPDFRRYFCNANLCNLEWPQLSLDTTVNKAGLQPFVVDSHGFRLKKTIQTRTNSIDFDDQ